MSLSFFHISLHGTVQVSQVYQATSQMRCEQLQGVCCMAVITWMQGPCHGLSQCICPSHCIPYALEASRQLPVVGQNPALRIRCPLTHCTLLHCHTMIALRCMLCNTHCRSVMHRSHKASGCRIGACVWPALSIEVTYAKYDDQPWLVEASTTSAPSCV